MKTFLHVGCNWQNRSGLKGFDSVEWREIRFDIDPSVYPDIVGTLTDMHAVATGSVDAIYSAHNIEHVFPHVVRLIQAAHVERGGHENRDEFSALI
jgi:hypothetical protein